MLIASLACANHELRADLSPVEPVLRPRRVLVEGVEHLLALFEAEALKPVLPWAGLRPSQQGGKVARVVVVVIVAVAVEAVVVGRCSERNGSRRHSSHSRSDSRRSINRPPSKKQKQLLLLLLLLPPT